jgi:RNA recognition motif-containing protein
MLSLQVAIPPHEPQAVTVLKRDLVGSLRVYVLEKGEDVPISSLHNKRLFLKYPSGNGIWLDNSNVFSTYAINPFKVFLSSCAKRGWGRREERGGRKGENVRERRKRNKGHEEREQEKEKEKEKKKKYVHLEVKKKISSY